MQNNQPGMHETTFLLIASALLAGVVLIACRVWAVNGDDPPWVADHAILTGVIAFVVCAVIGRVYLFMRRIEDRR